MKKVTIYVAHPQAFSILTFLNISHRLVHTKMALRKNSVPRAVVVIALLFIGACAVQESEYNGYAQPGTWIESDWSGGQYESALQIEIEASPGEMLLAQDVSSPLLIFSDTAQTGIHELEVFQGKLYIAAATDPGWVDGGDVLSYDYATDSFQYEYSVEEQGILKMHAHEGKLYIPGLDPIGSPPFGNLYIYDGDKWVKKETVPEAVYVFDMNFYQGKIFVTTGSYDPVAGKYHGNLLESNDEGDTWNEVFRVEPLPPYNVNFRRLLFMCNYNDKLYIQSDCGQPEGEVIFTYDGDTVDAIPLSPQYLYPGGAYAVLLEFDGKFFFLNLGHLHIYDGQNWEYVPLFLGGDIDPKRLTAYNGWLYAGSEYGVIFSSKDGKNWEQIGQVPEVVDETGAFESWHGRLYIGTRGKEALLFVSASADSGELISKVHDFETYIQEGTIAWDALLPPGTSVRVQLRSANFPGWINDRPFIGPDGTTDSFYQNSGQSLSRAHSGQRFIQYRVLLGTDDPGLSPILEEVIIKINP